MCFFFGVTQWSIVIDQWKFGERSTLQSMRLECKPGWRVPRRHNIFNPTMTHFWTTGFDLFGWNVTEFIHATVPAKVCNAISTCPYCLQNYSNALFRRAFNNVVLFEMNENNRLEIFRVIHTNNIWEDALYKPLQYQVSCTVCLETTMELLVALIVCLSAQMIEVSSETQAIRKYPKYHKFRYIF